ncbi:hypothetical protein NL676_036123 [Syzygium grande]|nr:hypothetical protein NL676_036123 [Syzygium grande]
MHLPSVQRQVSSVCLSCARRFDRLALSSENGWCIVRPFLLPWVNGSEKLNLTGFRHFGDPLQNSDNRGDWMGRKSHVRPVVSCRAGPKSERTAKVSCNPILKMMPKDQRLVASLALLDSCARR